MKNIQQLNVTASISEPQTFETEQGQVIEYVTVQTNILGVDIKLKPCDATSKQLLLAYSKKYYKDGKA